MSLPGRMLPGHDYSYLPEMVCYDVANVDQSQAASKVEDINGRRAAMGTKLVRIEDWDGDGAIRIPDAVLQELEVDVGDALYLIEEYVGTARCLILSKTPQISDRTDELVAHWSRE